jgi:hypothetical protein
MRFAAHAIRKNVQVQGALHFAAIFVILSDAPDIAARPGFDAQRIPHLNTGTISTPRFPWDRRTRVSHFETPLAT